MCPSASILLRGLSAESTNLKSVLQEKIPVEQEKVREFRKKHGATKVGEVTVDMVSEPDFLRYIHLHDNPVF